MRHYFLFFTISFFVLINSNSYCQLSGNYTVGTGGQYSTLTAAVNDASAQGINGPVTFNLFNGTYDGSVTINGIPGSSQINTVTIRSQSGNRDSVIFQSKIFVNNDGNIVFEHITFKRVNASGVKLEIGRNSDFIRVSDCLFTADNSNPGDPNVRDILTTGLVAGLVVEGCKFENEVTQIQIKSFNLKMTGNTILGGTNTGDLLFQGFSVELDSCNGSIIDSNFVKAPNTSIPAEAFRISRTAHFNFTKNKILGLTGLATSFCGDIDNRSLIANNFFIANHNPINQSQGLDFVHNTFNGELGFFFISHTTLLDNIFYNTSLNPVLEIHNYTSFTSDYNNFTNDEGRNIIVAGGAHYNTVSQYSTATGLDQHSKSQTVHFVSPTDLHLTGSSIGDVQIAGIPSPLVTDDIDGHSRSTDHPYKGAHEVTEFALPVLLSGFSYSLDRNNVTLHWTTSSELNNSGFNVERAVIQQGSSINNYQWQTVAFVDGYGTSTVPVNYTFLERLAGGRYAYRLKQSDYNGNFEYFNLEEEVMVEVAAQYRLSQNYPNPFNPVTNLNFEIPNDSKIKIAVYDAGGKLVGTIVDEFKTAGYYTVGFDGSALSSGIYFYRLEAEGRIVDTKRMVIVK